MPTILHLIDNLDAVDIHSMQANTTMYNHFYFHEASNKPNLSSHTLFIYIDAAMPFPPRTPQNAIPLNQTLIFIQT